MCVRLRRGSRQGVDVQCETRNPARGRVRFHHTFCHSLAEGRRGLSQGYLRILELLLSYGRLDFLDEALECTESRMIKVVAVHCLAGSANRRFMYNRHSRTPLEKESLYIIGLSEASR